MPLNDTGIDALELKRRRFSISTSNFIADSSAQRGSDAPELDCRREEDVPLGGGDAVPHVYLARERGHIHVTEDHDTAPLAPRRAQRRHEARVVFISVLVFVTTGCASGESQVTLRIKAASRSSRRTMQCVWMWGMRVVGVASKIHEPELSGDGVDQGGLARPWSK